MMSKKWTYIKPSKLTHLIPAACFSDTPRPEKILSGAVVLNGSEEFGV